MDSELTRGFIPRLWRSNQMSRTYHCRQGVIGEKSSQLMSITSAAEETRSIGSLLKWALQSVRVMLIAGIARRLHRSVDIISRHFRSGPPSSSFHAHSRHDGRRIRENDGFWSWWKT